MKRSLCLLLTFSFILVLFTSCSTSTSTGGTSNVNISINGNQASETVETSDTSINDPTTEQTTTSKPTWFYVLMVVICLPLFIIGIWLITIIAKVYRNRNKQF